MEGVGDMRDRSDRRIRNSLESYSNRETVKDPSERADFIFSIFPVFSYFTIFIFSCFHVFISPDSSDPTR